MTNVAYPGCYCADCVEGNPSARITGDKDRENPVEGAPTNRWLATEVKRLRNVLRHITELAYVDHQSGNQNYEYLQGIADSALRINAQTEKLVDGAPHYATLQAGVALYEALRRNRIGWENVIDLGLLPERHRPAAQALIDEADTVLKQWREVAQ